MAIEVYNVVLKPETIIGVGPLVRMVGTDPISLARKQLRLQFDLYCVYYRITITTDPLSFDSADKELSSTEVERIREDWERLRENLAQGYPIETGFPILCQPQSMPGV